MSTNRARAAAGCDVSCLVSVCASIQQCLHLCVYFGRLPQLSSTFLCVCVCVMWDLSQHEASRKAFG